MLYWDPSLLCYGRSRISTLGTSTLVQEAKKIIFVGYIEEPGETECLFCHSTVTCLAPQCHTAETLIKIHKYLNFYFVIILFLFFTCQLISTNAILKKSEYYYKNEVQKNKKESKTKFCDKYLFCIFSWPANVVHCALYCWWVASAQIFVFYSIRSGVKFKI